MRKTIAACALTAIAVGGGTASAAKFVTSRDIADGGIQTRDIARNAISLDRLSPSVRAALGKKAKDGVNGKDGAAGLNGAAGRNGVDGKAGRDGNDGTSAAGGLNGTDGAPGQDGVNPAMAVMKSGDAGWTLTGANPAAKLAAGELALAGGFDAGTAAGGIGITRGYSQAAPLPTLSALSYTARVDARPAGSVNAPVIHVTLTGARRAGSTSTFTNLVFEPANNGGIGVGETKTFDARAGQWWSTNDLVGHPRQATASLDAFITDNPDARILAISVDNGGSSANTIPAAEFDAAADNVVIGFGADFTRYDFGG